MIQLYFVGTTIGLLVVIIFLAGYLKAKRRREVLEQAVRMGFVPVVDRGWASIFSLPHPLFQHGHGKTVDNVIEGSADGLRARLFDYQYTVGSGKSSNTHGQTVAAFQSALAGMPAFQMYPEHFYHKIAELLGFNDIDFDGFPDFSDNYRLLGPDEAAIRGFFNPGVVSALGRDLGWTVEGQGQTLLVYKPDIRVDPADFPDFLARARAVAGAFGLR